LGGLFFALLVGYFLYSTLHLGSNSWFLDAFIVSISSLTGDLAASHFKRRHGVKDYSQLIPYQGGFLDRFDSLLLAGAVFYAINGPLSIILDSTKHLSLLLSLASSCANH
jgi:CDP-diglyceride synthetase